jgi:RNA polymerase sigma-70 factor (ECF subfamily)
VPFFSEKIFAIKKVKEEIRLLRRKGWQSKKGGVDGGVEEWVKRARDGDLEAFSQIVREYEARVWSLALRLLKNPEDAKDAVQESFLKVFRQLGEFRGESQFTTWLYRIVVNTCLDMARKKKREQSRCIRPSQDDEQFLERLPDHGPVPESVAIEREVRRTLLEAIDELPDKYRILLILHVQQGLTYQETAEILGLPVRTVGTRIHRAKERLRRKLAPVWKGVDGLVDRQAVWPDSPAPWCLFEKSA